jgi:hypothetical protein
MQIPLLSGIVTDGDAEFRTAYPVNLVPCPKQTGISNGYLRPADGILPHASGTGIDRGGINWSGSHYRVLGTSLVLISPGGAIGGSLGTVAGVDRVKFDYSPSRLAIVGGGNAYYYDGSTFTQVTDPDLGTVFDVIYIDGFFMFTDGEFLIVTELVDPTQVDPLKYGTAETDPDAIRSIHKIRNEPNAVGRYTIETYENVGGSNFPYQRIEGARVSRGAIGRNCACVFGDENSADAAIAFLGSGLKEPPSVYLGSNAASRRIATREIDTLLQTYSEAELSTSVVESRFDKGHQHLLIHLPDRTIVYDAAASAAAEEPVWFTLTSTLGGFEPYRGRNLVWVHDKWIVGDPLEERLGELTLSVSSHYGADVRWEFATLMVYNQGASGQVHELELVALTGRTAFGVDPYIATSYSKDGLSWSQDRPIKVGARGERDKRLVWRQQGTIGHFRVQRFRGDSQSFASFARLEAQIEPLAFATP